MQNAYKWLLFDLDDTLVDFKASMKQSLENAHRRFFQAHIEFSAFEEQFSLINHRLWGRAESGAICPSEIGRRRFEELMDGLNVAFHPEVPEYYENELIVNSRWIEKAEDVLIELLQAGVKMAFVTNGFAHIQRAKYRNLQLHRFTDVLMISEEVGHSKPHPKMFIDAMQLISAEQGRALVVGDSLSSDGKGAMHAGIDFCWFNPLKKIREPDCAVHVEIQHLSELLENIQSCG